MAITLPTGPVPGQKMTAKERDKMQRDSEAAIARIDAQNGMSPGREPATAADMYGDLRSEQEAKAAKARAILNNPKYRKRRVYTENKLRPVVEQRATTLRGSDKPLPTKGLLAPGAEVEVPEMLPGESVEEYAKRVQAPLELPSPVEGESEAAYSRRYDETVAQHEAAREVERQKAYNEDWDPRDIGQPGAPGMAEAYRQAGEETGGTVIDQMMAIAEQKREMANKASWGTDEVTAAQNKAQEFVDAQTNAIKTLQTAENEARKMYEETPSPDHKRYVKSMTGGQKIWAALGAIAGGWRGSTQVIDLLEREIERDTDAQIADYEAAKDRYGATMESTSRGVSVLERLIDITQNIPAAAELRKKMEYEDALLELDAVIAETTIPSVQAELKQAKIELEDRIRAQEDALEIQLQTTPEKIGHTFDPLGSSRKKLEAEAELAESRAWEASKLGAEAYLEGEKRRAAARDKLDDLTERRMRGEGGDYRLLRYFSKETAPAQALYSDLVSFLEDYGDTDIAGRGGSRIADWTDPNERANAEIRLINIVDRLARSRSGAALTEDEKDMYLEQLRRGIGDEQLLRNMRLIMQTTYNNLSPMWDSLPPSARELYTKEVQKDAGRSRMVAHLNTGVRVDLPGSSAVDLDTDEERDDIKLMQKLPKNVRPETGVTPADPFANIKVPEGLGAL